MGLVTITLSVIAVVFASYALLRVAKLSSGHADLASLLTEVVATFKADDNGGATLQDVMNHLRQAAHESRVAAETLRDGVESQRILAQQDRDQIHQLLVNLARLGVKTSEAVATGLRIEEAAVGVARDLSNAHRRADEAAHDGEAGLAADAAARQTIKEKRMEAEEAG